MHAEDQVLVLFFVVLVIRCLFLVFAVTVCCCCLLLMLVFVWLFGGLVGYRLFGFMAVCCCFS